MENRYRTNLKKVYLSDQELIILNKNLAQSQCPSFSHYARKTLLDPGIARAVNQSHLLSLQQVKELQLCISELEKQLQKDFDIKCQQLREFYGHH